MRNRKFTFPMMVFAAALVLSAALLVMPGDAAAERLSLAVNVANVRSGPGTDYPVLWRMEKYTPIRAISRHGDWVFFEDYEKTRGWLHGDLVDKTPTVITSAELSNIRSSPSTDHEVIFQAERGVPFKVTGRRGAWINIQHADGDKGWIHESLVW